MLVPFRCPTCRRSFLVPDEPAAQACPACRRAVPVGDPAPPELEGDLVRLRRSLARRVREREAALQETIGEGPARPDRPAGPWYYRWAEQFARAGVGAGLVGGLAGFVVTLAQTVRAGGPAADFLLPGLAWLAAGWAVVTLSLIALIAVDTARLLRDPARP